MKKRFFCFVVFLSFFQPFLFSWDKWIVVTTIQYPTPQLRKLANIPGWRLVVVGDKKTPKDWYLENCDYLSPERQLELGYELAEVLPWNHYSRKNIGYLFALQNGAKMIYETDDDNEPMGELNPCLPRSVLPSLTTKDNCVNVFGYFGRPEVWPRGFPLDKIVSSRTFKLLPLSVCIVGVEQGVVNESPDVDAIFRLTQDRMIKFNPNVPCFLPQGIFCPFNSQNTFFHPIAFFTLYLPSFVSMRVSDIWRGYFSQRLMWEFDSRLVFSGPNAVQDRNYHSLLDDFFQEQSLYLRAGKLLDFLSGWNCENSKDPFQMMTSLFEDLVQAEFLDKKELPLLNAWINDLQKVGYRQIFEQAEKGLRFYSQYEQDRYLYENVFKDKRNGVFVDIGAHDGITFSNTYFFERFMEWTGVCVEPIPEVFDCLKKNRKAICVQGCIYDKSDRVDFLRIKGYSEMLSGIVNNYDRRHIRRIQQEIGENGGASEIISVKCYPLNQILRDNNIFHIDYLSIDTEGGELEILQSIDFDSFDIDIINVENNFGSIMFHRFLKPLGYKKILSIGSDEIYQKIKVE